jgi:dTDP-4-dehydrorhamnose 3,5-epimerase
VKFAEARLDGVFVIELERHEDQRGFFARSFCAKEFAAHRLPASFVQCNVSYNRSRGTLRGMHYQLAPCEEGKLVRVTRGSALDVVLDLRPCSPTFREWSSFELTEENGRALYVAPGLAHGFQTLTDNVEVLYHMTEFYDPRSARGVRWDDPAFGIVWPILSPTLSERDASFPDFEAS